MTPAVLVIGDDADELAALIGPDIPVTTAGNAGDALRRYDDQPVLFGAPDAIAAVIDDMPAVRWVQSTWAGVNPLLERARRDYLLTGVRDVFGPQMSEYVLGYLLAHELRVVQRGEQQRLRRWYPAPSGALAGKRMGILGTGSIGQAIARQAASFGMRVSGLSRTGRPAAVFETVFALERIGEFLPGLDYVVCVLPATKATDRLLDGPALSRLPPHAVVVNVGRSNVIDDDALLEALAGGKLGGAVLDVFDEEPLPEDSPLWAAPNLTITAHIAAQSHPAIIVPLFTENYRRFASAQDLLHVIDFEQGY